MKKVAALIGLAIGFNAAGQTYFQQDVDYKIDVELFDTENVLRGFETFDYTNNSPDELTFIYIHLWPNGYANEKTSLGEQLYEMGNYTLQFAEEADKGYIDSLNFKVNGQTAAWQLDAEHIDICKLTLNTPLKSGEKVTISTPFKVKIPSGDISRMGFVGESYQITQWYPKPAVYDQNGWHQMPYLTQGEFYSEYGSFDVSITLPKNYVVGATGDLQTQSEIEFLASKAAETAEKYKNGTFDANKKMGGGSTDFPDSDTERKTIRYTQKNVHDFAWFADKRFEVLKGEVALPNSGEKVTTWAMFVTHHSDLWSNSIEYLNDAIFYYSKWNGDYPYKQVTAVDGTISAGGGMEYPNVTVIGDVSSKEELEVVIVHEVGHNWFYGLLGSNERDHAWMDEGLNTLNEIRYMETKYPGNTRLSDMANGIVGKLHLENLGHQDISDLTYAISASYGLDQPIELHSADYSSLNYGAIVYAKTGLVFTYVKDYLGDTLFDKAMHAYYDEWHYKHPQPTDIEKTLERETGKDLTWLFDDLIQTTKHIDYKIQSVKMKDGQTVVTVRNTGQVNSPVRVDAFSFGKIRESKWIEPGDKVSQVTFKGDSYDQFIIDSGKQMPELNRNNNYWTKKGLFHRTEPFKMEFLAGDNEGDKWNSYWLPFFGGNTSDKFMLGLVFHNQTWPKNKFEYTIAPLFSFGRTNIAGLADFNYSWVPARHIRMITLGATGKTFGNGLDIADSVGSATHYVVQPYLNFEIGKPAGKKYYRQTVQLQGHYILESGKYMENLLTGGTFRYGFRYSKRIQSLNANVKLDYFNMTDNFGSIPKSDLMNLGLDANYQITYLRRMKGNGRMNTKSVSLRVFLGQNLFYNGPQSGRYGFSLGGQTGTQDVTYDQYMFGRNETSGLWANQRIENQGGFKTVSSFGTSTQMVFGSNIVIEIPYLPFAVAYADYGIFTDSFGDNQPVSDAGLGLRISSAFAVYFPLYESTNLKNSYLPGTNYGEKIRFTLNLKGLSLSKLLPATLSR